MTDLDVTTLSENMQQALASLRLEGIVLSDESLADLKLFDAGQLSKEEILNRLLTRIQR